MENNELSEINKLKEMYLALEKKIRDLENKIYNLEFYGCDCFNKEDEEEKQ